MYSHVEECALLACILCQPMPIKSVITVFGRFLLELLLLIVCNYVVFIQEAAPVENTYSFYPWL